jgi:hypothetical protein
VGLVAVLAGGGVAGYVLVTGPNAKPTDEHANRSNELDTDPSTTPVVHIAPFPHEPKPLDLAGTKELPSKEPPGSGDVIKLPGPVVEVPKKDRRRPVAVMMKVDPKIAPRRHFDNPDDIATLPDLNTGDRVVLTGKLRILRVHSVNGKGFLDASGLVAEEVEIRGDLNNQAQVIVNAPQGTVKVSGFAMGSAKLTVTAPGGTVLFTSRLTGGSTTTITAKHLTTQAPLSGGTKVNVTLTTGGSLKITKAEEGATVTYRKSAASDPAPVIEKGEFRGGAKLMPAK